MVSAIDALSQCDIGLTNSASRAREYQTLGGACVRTVARSCDGDALAIAV
jgi:hypothetical protein